MICRTFWKAPPSYGVLVRQSPKALIKFSVKQAKKGWSDSRIKFSGMNKW